MERSAGVDYVIPRTVWGNSVLLFDKKALAEAVVESQVETIWCNLRQELEQLSSQIDDELVEDHEFFFGDKSFDGGVDDGGRTRQWRSGGRNSFACRKMVYDPDKGRSW